MDEIRIKQLEAEAKLYQSLASQCLANGHKEAAARDFVSAAERWKELVDYYRKEQGLEEIDLNTSP